MLLKVILGLAASVAIGYSAAPLVSSESIEGICCADDGHCALDQYCEFRVGDDCSAGRKGYCVPIPE